MHQQRQILFEQLQRLVILDEDAREEYVDSITEADTKSEFIRLQKLFIELLTVQDKVLIVAMESDPLLYPEVLAKARLLWQSKRDKEEEDEKTAELAALESELE